MITGRVPYRTIDHTADLGMEVVGSDPVDLFERCAAAMFDVMIDVGRVRPSVESSVRVEAREMDELLVAWLSELLGRSMEDGMVYGQFGVSRMERSESDWVLEATVSGEPLDESRHLFKTELKAVTYHGLSVAENGDGHWARVFFDV